MNHAQNTFNSSVSYGQVKSNLVLISALMLITATVFQKFALPGVSLLLPVSSIVLPLMTLISWLSGNTIIHLKSLILFTVFLLFLSVSFLINGFSSNVSISSIFLIISIQMNLVFRPKFDLIQSLKILIFFRNIMIFFSLIGIFQFGAQFFIPKELAFFIDYYVPKGVLLEGYNNLIPLYYGSPTLKSNGLFFAEPSFFGQLVALSAIIEMVTRRNIFVLAVFGFAIICSYSGTGLITLLFFGGYWMIRKGKITYILFAALAICLIVSFGSALQINAITDRVDEIARPGSSGYARFISPFDLISGYQLNDIVSVLFGKGPGVYSVFGVLVPFGAFDPTWSKVIFEYGFVGAVTYGIFLFVCTSGAQSPLKMPIITIYLFFGGYLANASIVTFIVTLVVWGPREWRWENLDSKSKSQEQTPHEGDGVAVSSSE